MRLALLAALSASLYGQITLPSHRGVLAGGSAPDPIYDYYVDSAAGNDTNAGTKVAPFASFKPLAVQNLVTYSADFTNPDWTIEGGATKGVDTVTFAAAEGSKIYESVGTIEVPMEYVITCDAREVSGTGKMRLELISSSPTTEWISSDFDLTTTWQTISFVMSGQASTNIYPRIRNGSDAQVHTVQIRNLRVNSAQIGGTVASPSIYVETGATSLGDCLHTPCNWDSVLTTGKAVGLKAGGAWHATLALIHDGVTVGKYGAGALPMLDASDPVTTSWSKTAGKTNVYQTVVTLEAGTPSDPDWYTSVWENGTRFAIKHSTADVDATPGSYYPVPIGAGATATVYVHASDNSNPGSNGKTYEYAARMYGLNAMGINSVTLNGIQSRRQINTNGSIIAGRNATITNVSALEGNKHNILFAAGSKLTNVVANTWYYEGLDSVPIIGFDTTAPTLGFEFIGIHDAGIYVHGNDQDARFAFIKYTNCSGALQVGDSFLQVILDHSQNSTTIYDLNATDVRVLNSTIGPFTLSEQYGIYAPGAATVLVQDSMITGPGLGSGSMGIAALANNGALTISGSTITDVYQAIGTSGTGQTINIGTTTLSIGQYYIYAFTGNPTITSDHNTFSNYSVGAFASTNGSVVSTLADWKALGYDAHSTP